MSLADRFKGASKQGINLPLFQLEPFTILEFIPDQGCYRGRPAYDTTNGNPKILYPLSGVSSVGSYTEDSYQNVKPPKNFQQGVQISKIYEPQTVVLVAIPASDPRQHMDPCIGLILGDMTIAAFSKFDEAPKQIDRKEGHHNLNATNTYQQASNVNQSKTNNYYRGYLPESSIPGDFVIASKNVAITIDNYSTTTQVGPYIRTIQSSITGEVTEEAFIKNHKTATEADETYIIGGELLNVKRTSYNIKSSFFNCKEEKDGKLISIQGSIPVYRSQTFTGEMVEGEHKFVYNYADTAEDQLPIYHEAVLTDGSLSISSCSGLHFKKTGKFKHITCTGGHFKQLGDDTFNIKDITYSDDDNIVRVLPEQGSAQNERLKNINTNEVDISPMYKGESSLDFNEDGSICIKDAWGSYILLAEGNVQIHSANNLFIVSGRDHINISGGVHTIKASRDIQLDASEGDLLINAKNNIKCNATNVSLESSEVVAFNSKSIMIKGDNIKLDGEEQKPGVIQIGGNNCSVALTSKDLVMYGKTSSTLTTDTGCISVSGGTVKVAGSLYVGGNVTLGECKASIKVNNETLTLTGSSGSIYVTDGSILVKNMIRSTGTLVVKQVVAESVAARDSNEGKMYKVRTVPMDTTESRLDRVKETKDINVTVQPTTEWSAEHWDYLAFNFDKSSQACYYIVQDDRELQTTAITTEAINKAGMLSYVYPGEIFWSAGGIRRDIKDYTGQVIDQRIEGFSNYRFNDNNVTPKD